MDTNSQLGGENLQNSVQNSKKTRSFWKLLVALGAIVFLFVAYVIWAAFFSPQAVSERETQKNYEQAMKALSEYEEMMRNDIYGGKTPQETLDMFIDALEKEDFELASRYFSLSGPIDKSKWRKESLNLKDSTIKLLTKAVPMKDQESSSNTFWFVTYKDNGDIGQLIELSFNESSGVWKIESL